MSNQWPNQSSSQQGPPGPQLNHTNAWAQDLHSPLDTQQSGYVTTSTHTTTSSTHTSDASQSTAPAQQHALPPPSVSSGQIQHVYPSTLVTQQRQQQQQQALLTQRTPLAFQGAAANTMTSQMVMQEGLSAESGQHRRQAIQQGADSVQRFDQRIQVALRSLGICPRAYHWYPTSDGFLCGGGNHFFPDSEIDRMLNVPCYLPRFKAVNSPRMSIFGQHVGFEPLKKPPASTPRHETAWIEYEMAQMAGRNMDMVARMYFRNRGYNI